MYVIFPIAESNELFTALRQRDPLLAELKSRFGCNTSVGSMFPIVSRAFRVVTQRKGETLSLSRWKDFPWDQLSTVCLFCDIKGPWYKSTNTSSRQRVRGKSHTFRHL